jgi:hypothetical protein
MKRENRIRKTKAGWSLDEKLTAQDRKEFPNVPVIKDEKGNMWTPVMTSRKKKELVDYIENKSDSTIYKKVHTNSKAAASHIDKIRARGGNVQKIISKGKITVISTYKIHKLKYRQKTIKF